MDKALWSIVQWVSTELNRRSHRRWEELKLVIRHSSGDSLDVLEYANITYRSDAAGLVMNLPGPIKARFCPRTVIAEGFAQGIASCVVEEVVRRADRAERLHG